MNKIAVFGGTFDPIHIGHIHIAYNALYALNLDKVIFMPSGNPPHKINQNITDRILRYEMVKIATREEKKFQVSSYEINKKTLSYTFETLEYLNSVFKNHQLCLLTGADCLMNLETWKNIQDIFKLCTFVVFTRPGLDMNRLLQQKTYIEKKYQVEIVLLDMPMLEVSSTKLRDMIYENKNVSYLLPYGVYDFINQLDIYK